jgi:alpha-glucan,water dikinase
MPEDTPPEWQAAEYAKARLDLQLEVLNGVSLNDIRRKYNQDTVEGDDEPMNVGDANVMLDDAAEKFSDGVTSTVTSNVVPMETETHAPRGLRAHD